jgi:ATP-binding cassette, subfamily B, bacterial
MMREITMRTQGWEKLTAATPPPPTEFAVAQRGGLALLAAAFRSIGRIAEPDLEHPTVGAPVHEATSSSGEELRLATLPDMPISAMTIRQVLIRALVYWRPYWIAGSVVLVLMALQEGFLTFYDLSLGRITDQVLIARDGSLLIQIVAQLAVAYLIAATATVIGDYLTARIGARILNNLRFQMFSHLQRLSMRFYSHAQTGDMVARFTSDLSEIDKGLTVRFTDGNLALIGILLNVPTLFVLQWRLALIALGVAPLVMAGPQLFARRASRAFFRLKREQAALASAVQENVKAQPIVKIFGLEHNILARLRTQLADLFHQTVRATFVSQLVGTTSSLGVRLASLLVIGAGAYLAFHGYMSIGSLVAFTLLLIDVTGNAYSLSKKVVPSLIAAGSGIQRIDELLNEPAQVMDEPDAEPLARLSQAIAFEDVCFSYTLARPTLDHVRIIIPAGQYVAFVGPSGAGKTTILSLIARFYDVNAGAITFDGRDIRHVTQASLRAQIGAVLQDTLLFNTTIRENIRLGKLDATDDEIEAAARAAEIHDHIASLPQGYDTLVGEMGGLLSGGQRQRLAIARAIVRDPAILMLDEPTSDLDVATEAAIHTTLEHLAQDRTVIAVTHRLSAIQRANRIFVMEAGHVVEQGRHDELLDRRGLYFRLWQTEHSAIPSEGNRGSWPR